MNSNISQTIQVIEKGMCEGLHTGAQLYVSLRGEVMGDVAIGEVRTGIPMRTDTLMPWRSAGKPIGAVAIAQLKQRGKLDWDDSVARFIPEFGTNGKEAITIRHLLTQTAGLRHVANTWSTYSSEQILRQICAARLEPQWRPGHKAGYHAFSTWFLLGEIVHRVDGRAFCQYACEEIFSPLGMKDSWFALSEQQYRAYGDRMGILNENMDSPHGAGVCRPASSARGPIRELGKFYEFLLSPRHGTLAINRQGTPVLSPDLIRFLTSPQRVGLFDHTFKHVVDWGFGFMINSQPYDPARPYGFGPHASPRTFGHSGSQSSVGLADPDHGLVVGLMFAGLPGEEKHQRRLGDVLKTLYEELKLGK
jgi:CubicO group peptidase (beta-lactamase class C family)